MQKQIQERVQGRAEPEVIREIPDASEETISIHHELDAQVSHLLAEIALLHV